MHLFFLGKIWNLVRCSFYVSIVYAFKCDHHALDYDVVWDRNARLVKLRMTTVNGFSQSMIIYATAEVSQP